MLEDESLSSREPGEPTPIVLSRSDESPLAELGKAWKKSVYLKVLSLIVVIALFGVITFIILANSASKSLDECKEKLSNEETEKNKCIGQKESLQDEIERHQNDLKKKQEEYKRLSERKNELEKTHKNLTDKSKNLDKEIENLTEDNKKIQQRVDNLRESKNKLVQEISILDKNITEVNKSITNTKAEIKKTNDTRIWYIAGVAAIGLTDILTIYQAFSVNRELKEEQERLYKYTKENNEIQANIDKEAIALKKLEEEKKKLDDEYGSLYKQLQECEDAKAKIGIEIQTCERGKEVVRREMSVTRLLAIEQAKAYYLEKYTDNVVKINHVYNSTSDKFSLDQFRKSMTDLNRPVVILRTTNRRFFGMGFNQKWPKDNGKYSIPSAFTFSMNRGILCTSRSDKENFELKDNYFFQIGPPEISIKFFNETLAEGIANSTDYFSCHKMVDDDGSFYDISESVKYTHIYGYNIKIGKEIEDYEDLT